MKTIEWNRNVFSTLSHYFSRVFLRYVVAGGGGGGGFGELGEQKRGWLEFVGLWPQSSAAATS